MRFWFDLLAKGILRSLLRPVVRVETEHEIVGHSLTADVWVASASVTAEWQAQSGVLGQMIARGPCIVEPFSQTPRPRDIRTCLCKQYSLHHAQMREATRERRPTPVFPGLWIISPGRPRTVLDQANCWAMTGWPTGFFERTSWDAFHIVAIDALPRTKETLPLRLLGRDDTLVEAIRDLGALPDSAWPKQLLVPTLVAFNAELPQDQKEGEIMQFVQEIDAIYEQWEKRVKQEGREEGLAEGQRTVLLKLLRQRFGKVPSRLAKQIRAADTERLHRWIERIIPAKNLAEVFE